jgi:hypothetical protein
MREGSLATGIRILFLYFHKLLQHDSKVHFQRLEEVCVDFILDHVFGLCASESNVSLAEQGGDVSFGYLGLRLGFILKLAQFLGSNADLGLGWEQRIGEG